ncbi:zinc finger CCCH domain-containing protein 19-like [Rutidosis leptorrhynchoides]|uniref:zinc finger CCCH domain-containing protein 19-like n=1 Tax=Rutidosis leptorrhynchoides TaxID=125765 RepID=UPI003A99E8F8
MEVEEDNTIIHLQQSTITTESNEKLLEINSTNDNELGKLSSESNTQDVIMNQSPDTVTKLDDPKPIEAANDDVADVERGGCELTDSVKVDGAECASVVVEQFEENDSVLPVAKIGENEEDVMDDVKDDGCGDDIQDENVETVNEKQIVEDEDEEEDEPEEEEEEEEEGVKEDEHMSGEELSMSEEEKVVTESAVKRRGRGPGKKRKREGKDSKAIPKNTNGGKKMTEEEDVCFICFDGGDLVLCDKRDCPKAYHPACVNRDEAFFQTKGKWNCGWHLCSVCEKKADYMCYTCTFSLCKTCIKSNVLYSVKKNKKKGFCEACVKTIMLIDNDSQENQGNVDIYDKNSWEYMFKIYWTDIKEKLNLSLVELVEAKNAWKGYTPVAKHELPAGHSDSGSGSERPSKNVESQTKKTRGRKPKKHKTHGSAAIASEGTSVPEHTEWASGELLEFVTHMGCDKSYQSQFDVQALLLEYIKRNKLRDTRRKSQIICDARLRRLFGKPRVGHFEMLKLLESHFFIKEDDGIQGSVVDTEVSPIDDDETTKGGKDKKRKIRKKGDREPQSNRDDYAAIDIHNINLIYMKRKLVEDLLGDAESFCKKVVGTFVRIRILGAKLKHDIYRLVQVTGTTKGDRYAVGKKMTDTKFEILNLDKKETISIDIISNQDFTEEECKRLRQSIKCGLINRLTVGDILDKAIELQSARVNDEIEAEIVKLNHLRDRASDLGRKKELRLCVEKLQILKTPEERFRRLQDIPVIHDDPTMDPKHESEEDADEEDVKKQDTYKSPVNSSFSKSRDSSSKRNTDASTSRNSSSSNISKKAEDRFERHNENLLDQGRNRSVQTPNVVLKRPNSTYETEKVVASPKEVSESSPKVNETEKIWHYKDPSGKIQGPFSMAQLRKWNNSKFFPVDLRIWRKSEKEDDGILLTDALEGRFHLKISKPSHDDVGRVYENLPSPTPDRSSALSVGPSSYHIGNERLQSPTPNSSQLTVSVGLGVNKDPKAMVQSGHVVQSFGAQNPHGWGAGSLHESQLSPVAGPQQLAYSPWGSAPNIVQNPTKSFLQQPPQPNVGPVRPTQSINWGTPQLTGNANMLWGVQSGLGASSGPTQGSMVSVNVNPNWVGPPSNPGAVLPTGNQKPGWGSPTPMNQHQAFNRSGFSGDNRNRGPRGGGSSYQGNRRHWDKPGSFNNRPRSRDYEH